MFNWNIPATWKTSAVQVEQPEFIINWMGQAGFVFKLR